jgi:O-antigen ligase
VAFYAWQVFRTALLFVAISRVTASVKDAPLALIAGLSLGIIIESAIVASQFLRGVSRPGGTLNNSNYMGLSLDFVVFPALAIMLGTRRTIWPGLTVVAAVVISVCGGSRATLGLLGGGLMLTVLLSILHRRSSRKFGFAAALALLLMISAPLMVWSAHQRSQDVLESSDRARTAMKLAARMLIADYPFGVGANEYVVIANSRGYSARADVPWNEENRVVPVHNTYYLVTAEMGFIGLIGLVGILSAFFGIALAMFRRRWAEESNELVPGLLATMTVLSVHIAFEFVAMDSLLHSLFAISTGILVGLYARSRAQQKAYKPNGPISQTLVSATPAL